MLSVLLLVVYFFGIKTCQGRRRMGEKNQRNGIGF